MATDEVPEGHPENPFLVAAGTPGNQRFGTLLKNLRERSSLSPQELAEQANVHVSFVRGIERGAQAPSVETARRLLACVAKQGRIKWEETGSYDLLIGDPATDDDVAFAFKAKVQGQNRRPDELGEWQLRTAIAVQKLFKEVPRMFAEGGQPPNRPGEPLAHIARRPGDEQPGWSIPTADAVFGRVIRLLAAADDDMLARVEGLLRGAPDPGEPDLSKDDRDPAKSRT